MKQVKKIRLLSFLLLAGLLLGSSILSAQVTHSGWLASFNTVKLGNKTSLHFDAQLRSTDRLKQVQALLLRPGLNYHFSKKLSASLGYAYISSQRTANGLTGHLPEHRIWQQLIYAYPVGRLSIAHRLRMEERFISRPALPFGEDELHHEGYNTSYRLRYFIRNVLPLVRTGSFTKGPFAALQNEVFLNTGGLSVVNGKTFDQNRLYLAVGYRLPNKIDLEVGYMNQYISTRSSFINNHIAQLAIYRRL